MAKAEKVQAHVGAIEYQKERARIVAGDLVVDVDVREILDDPARYVEDVLAAALVALTPILADVAEEASGYVADELNLGALDASDLEEAVNDALLQFQTDARPGIEAGVSAIADNVQAQVDAGVAEDTIAVVLTSTVSRDKLLSGVLSSVRVGAASTVAWLDGAIMERAMALIDALTGAGQDGQDAPAAQAYVWITAEDDSVCDDALENSCGPRHGEVRTLEEWTGLGLPRAPNLLCCSRRPQCRCQLELAGKGDAIPSPVSITATIKLAKADARKDYGQD